MFSNFSDIWTYQLNDQSTSMASSSNSNPFSYLSRKRRQIPDSKVRTWVNRNLMVGTFNALPKSVKYANPAEDVHVNSVNTRSKRQFYLPHIGRAYTLAAYSNPNNDIDWQYQKTLKVRVNYFFCIVSVYNQTDFIRSMV